MIARRLHYVTGKGGVGKSTIAAALALAAAGRGARVLAIELAEPAGLCRILGAVPPRPSAIVPAACGTHVMVVDGAAALGEYLETRAHLGPIARAIIAHPLYTAFVGAAPGVRELLAVGQIRDAFALQRRWDTVVVDAGASGHALEYVRMPAAAADTFAAGRVHREAAANAALLRDRASCSIHVVSTPEHMAVREAEQVVVELRRLGAADGAVFVNRCVPPEPSGVDDALAQLPAAIAGVLAPVRTRVAQQERGIAELENALGILAFRLPWLRTPNALARATALAPLLQELV